MAEEKVRIRIHGIRSMNHKTILGLCPSKKIKSGRERVTHFKNFIILAECVCETGLSRLLDGMKI